MPSGSRFSTGVLLVRPSKALSGIVDDVVAMFKNTLDTRKNGCHSEQTFLNAIVSGRLQTNLMLCLPQSMNCRNPHYLRDPNIAEFRKRSGCELDSGMDHGPRRGQPYILHFACGDKPWLNNQTAGTLYGRRWLSHLQACDAQLQTRFPRAPTI